jgi:transcriptional regulator with XRE-family HTH domain/tetratricopeptide (TPR) repeat protein
MATDRDEISSFGYWVKRRRKSLDLTQDALANLIGCSRVTIKKIESNERQPSVQLARLLAKHLQIPPEQQNQFISSARHERNIDRTSLSYTSEVFFTKIQVSEKLPAFLKKYEVTKSHQQTPFVAREREIDFLNRHLSEALHGAGRVIFISGEAGSGKTTLLTEFGLRAQEEYANLVVLRGNCTAYSGIGDPYLPFRDVLTMLTGDIETRLASGMISPENARRLWSLAPMAIKVLLYEGPHLLDSFLPASSLTKNIAARIPHSRELIESFEKMMKQSRNLDPNVEQVQILEQYTQIIQNISAERPLLILLDDLQWADRASVSLLFHLGRRLPGNNVIILGAFRPSDIAVEYGSLSEIDLPQPPLQAIINELKVQYGNILLDLGTSNEENGQNFVDALLDTEPNNLSHNFRRTLFRRTEGHPLFTVELLRVLQERGDLIHDSQGEWIEGDALDWDTLPFRVEAVLEQRLGRLDETLKGVLAVASVEGEIFTPYVLAQIQNVDERAMLQLLSLSIEKRHRLIQEYDENAMQGRRFSRFKFSHALFQQFLYTHLSQGERRLLHAQVGQVLEELYGEDRDEIAVQLAHHFQAAGEQSKAFAYAVRAAERAEDIFAFEEAIQHLELALSIIEPTMEASKALFVFEHLADDITILGDRVKAIDYIQKAIKVWSSAQNPDKMTGLRLDRKLGETVVYMTWFSDRRKFEALSKSSLEAGLQLAKDEPPHHEIVKLLITLSYDAWLPRVTPDWKRAEQFAQQAVAMAELLDSPLDLSAALDALGNVYGGLGHFEERLNVALQRLKLSQLPTFTDTRQKANVLQQVGQAHIQVGQYHKALPYLFEAEDLSRQAQAMDQQYRALRYQATCWYFLDRWDKVVEIDETVQALEKRFSNFSERVGPICFQKGITASALAFLGQIPKAETLRGESLAIMIANDGPREGWGRDNLF